MTISEFYEILLSDKDFQNPETGKLFFPAYIFTYNPEDEYEVRKEIKGLKERLIRPDNYVDTLILNIFDEFIEFLKSKILGKESLFYLILAKEESKDPPEETIALLKEKANSREFFDFINNKVVEHFNLPSEYKKVYLLLYGFGSIFPFLRTSEYLKNFEQHVKDYKLIVFYPGKYENQNYCLFNELNDENIYRAILINK